MKFQRKSIFIYTCIFVATIAVSGEIICRWILGLGNPPLSIRHPIIEYMFKPNQDVYRFGNRFITNEYGMRSEKFPLSKENNEVRILVFGDSVINGGNLTDQKDLATEIIRAELSNKTGKKITVGNISAGSWGPGNWLAYAKQYGFFDADFIILVTNSEDYGDNPTFVPLDANTHPTLQPISALIEGIERYLPRYLPKYQNKNSIPQDLKQLEKQKIESERKGIDDLTQFLKLAKETRKPILVIQYPKKTEILDGFEKGYFEIKDVCERLSVRSISLKTRLKESIDRNNNPYSDEIHPNTIGQAIIAREILDNFLAIQIHKF
jgi:lysophospholipase L1-like esterase